MIPSKFTAPDHRFLTTAAVASLLLLAACSSGAVGTTAAPASGGEATKAKTVSPCSLLTQAEVDTAVGQPLRPGKATIPNYDCSWTTSDFSASVSVSVSDWAAIKTSATANGTATPVSGVGDEALTKGGGLLYVRKGSVGFLLLIGGPHLDAQSDHGLAAEKVLAAAVLSRL